MTRRDDLDRLYEILERLKTKVGGYQQLVDCHGRMDWPERGVYFFFAADERRQSTEQRRLTRIGTHAVSTGSGASLWSRLRTHRGAKQGPYEGGGNNRGSVFRKRVGESIIERDGLEEEYPEWGIGSSAGREQRLKELELERQVSEYIRALPFLWVKIDDEPGPDSDRDYVERNAITLVSNYEKPPIDPREDTWLGSHSRSEKIRNSGIWNVDYVEEKFDSAFLDRLEAAVPETESL